MLFTISDGSKKEINAGNFVKIKGDFIPPYFLDVQIPVTKIDSGYPFVHFYKEESYQDEFDEIRTKVVCDEESAVSPELILEVF